MCANIGVTPIWTAIFAMLHTVIRVALAESDPGFRA
jgi:hypothetical protein